MDWDADDSLSPSFETEDISLGEFKSIDLRPCCMDSKLWPISMSEVLERRGGVRVAECSKLS